MAEKFQVNATVVRQMEIATGIYDLWLECDRIANAAVPGQFVSVYSNDKSRLLPRPISICETDKEKGLIRLVYRVAGKGTEEFSKCQAGDTLDILGPLGNGYPLDRMQEGKKAFLIGGGIGVPPLVELARHLPGEKQIVVGYRDELFLTQELGANGKVYIATEDGSTGTKGNVLDAIKANALTGDVIYACGPTPMLRALKDWALENNIECWLSLEQRMACGIGACLACVCQSKEKDEHSQVNNKRVCAEGPVFLSTEVEL